MSKTLALVLGSMYSSPSIKSLQYSAIHITIKLSCEQKWGDESSVAFMKQLERLVTCDFQCADFNFATINSDNKHATKDNMYKFPSDRLKT